MRIRRALAAVSVLAVVLGLLVVSPAQAEEQQEAVTFASPPAWAESGVWLGEAVMTQIGYTCLVEGTVDLQIDVRSELGTLWSGTSSGNWCSVDRATAANPYMYSVAGLAEYGTFEGTVTVQLRGQSALSTAAVRFVVGEVTQPPVVAPVGTPGPQGPQGEQGIQGERGDLGPSGSRGEQGSAGASGPSGPQGLEGPQGPAGASAPSLPVTPGLTRLGGVDRYATAVKASEAAFPNGTKVVLLVSGEGYADALASTPLALRASAAVLLVPSSGALPLVVANELRRLGAVQLYVLGGESAVSEGISGQVRTAAGA